MIRKLRIDFIITDDVYKPQCIFFSKVPDNGSMKPLFLYARFTLSHTLTWQPHAFADQLRSISCCRNYVYIRVHLWRHVRIGSILSRCFCNSKRKRTAYNWV